MIYFTDKNNPTFKALKRLKELTYPLIDAPDAMRLQFANSFLNNYRNEHKENPAGAVIERLGNFLLRPYIGNKDAEYLILSSYSLERRQANEIIYNDDFCY